MIYALFIVGLQIYCGVHCVRHHRNFRWLFLILFAPLIGSLIYLFAEVWPYLGRWEHTLDRHPRYRVSARAQQREREEFRAAYRIDTQENEAQKLMSEGKYQQAADYYRTCLHGPLENDPELLYGFAEASFAAQNFEPAIETLNKIRALSDYRPQQVRCLLARAYAASGQRDKAAKIFEQLMTKSPNLEAYYYCAVFLETFVSAQAARDVFRQVLSLAELSTAESHVEPWLEHARMAMQNVE